MKKLKNNIFFYSAIFFFLTSITSINLSLIAQNIVLNEIMFNSLGSNNEFIEIVNTSLTDTFDIRGYKIGYYTTAADSIVSYNDNYLLLPGDYALILEADYDFDNGIYKDLISWEVPIFVLDDNAFGSSGMANTTNRPVYLINKHNDTLDVYTYTANNPAGISDERVNWDSDEWQNSLVNLGTPGKRNSVSSLFYDLTIDKFSADRQNLIIGESINLFLSIKNLGSRIAEEFNVKIYLDKDFNGISESDSLIISEKFFNLESNGSINLNYSVSNIAKGRNDFIVAIDFTTDENVLNNQSTISVFGIEINEFRGDLVINEIMYAPKSPEPEWVELFNISNKTISLNNYKLADSKDTVLLTNSNLSIEPGEYFVITKSEVINSIYNNIENLIVTLFPTLNNDEDKIILIDSFSRVIDSVNYFSSWGGNSGKSLEKIDAESSSNDNLNWKESVTSATPGKINSVSKKQFDLTIEKVFTIPPIPTINEELNFAVIVKNIGKQTIDFTIDMFEDTNLDSLEDNLIETSTLLSLVSGDSLKFVFSTKIKVENKTQNFIFNLNTSDDDSTNNIMVYTLLPGFPVNSIVINEIMYSPINGEPEWIELFNKSDYDINFKNWKISDVLIKPISNVIADTNYIFKGNSFLVISKSDSIFKYYDTINSPVIILKFANLNNDKDGIVIKDNRQVTMDSVLYTSTLGGNNGKSLERIDPNKSSLDENNWKESRFSASPGSINSVTQKDYDVFLKDVFTNIKNPLINDEINFAVKIINIGKENINFTIEFYDDFDLDSLKDNLIESSNILSLQTKDSLIFNFQTKIKVKTAQQNFIFKLNTNDDDSTNNMLIYNLFPGYPPKSIIINEIAYAPQNEEPEWIELYNKSDYDIDIKNWKISDVLTNPITNKITTQLLIFPSQFYLVISKSNTIYNYYKQILSPVVELKFANLNNDKDGIVIKDNRNVTIDSVLYSRDWSLNKNVTLEKINYDYNSNDSKSWLSSLDIEGGTPGRINSVTPKQFDLVLKSISTVPLNPVSKDSVQIKIKIVNRGFSNASSFDIEFFYGKPLPNILFETQRNLTLLSGDSLIFTSQNKFEIRDTIYVAANIIYSFDLDIINNYLETRSIAGFNKKTILINEIMFNPSAGKPEWVEIINNSDSLINLKNWSIGDINSSSIITTDDYYFQIGEIIVLSNFNDKNFFPQGIKFIETSIPNLNNSKDAVVIYDFRNAMIDSVYYNLINHKLDVSLERINLNKSSTDLNNWASSLDTSGSTPGKTNSVLTIPEYEFSDLIINEIMYNPNDNNSEFVEIYNRSDKEVEMGGFKLEDENGNYFIISSESKIINPKSFFVIASDSQIFNNYNWLSDVKSISILNLSSLGLTNIDDIIILKDLWGNVIDSIHYYEKWHNPNLISTKNISLELINTELERNLSENWYSSVSEFGGTPGKQNSIFVNKIISKSKIDISPNPFSPDNDGFEDYTFISYKLTQPIAQIRIKIFDSKGRLVRTLANNLASGNEGTITFDGLDNNGKSLQIGIYVVFLEAINYNNSVVDVIKDVVVVARKL